MTNVWENAMLFSMSYVIVLINLFILGRVSLKWLSYKVSLVDKAG